MRTALHSIGRRSTIGLKRLPEVGNSFHIGTTRLICRIRLDRYEVLLLVRIPLRNNFGDQQISISCDARLTWKCVNQHFTDHNMSSVYCDTNSISSVIQPPLDVREVTAGKSRVSFMERSIHCSSRDSFSVQNLNFEPRLVERL
jgi:hypothetical protein